MPDNLNQDNTDPVSSLHLKQISFFILLIIIAYILFSHLIIFLSSFLGAVTFYVILRQWNMNLVNKRKFKKSRAALLLILLSVIIVLLPLYLFGNMLGGRIISIIHRSNEVLAAVNKFADNIQAKYHLEILSKDNINKASGLMATAIPNILGATFNTLTVLLMLYFILYFMLAQSKEMEAWLVRSIPLRDENVIRLGTEMHGLVLNNAIGVPLIALLQGIVALIGYVIFGVPDPLFWFAITAFGAMLPVIGAAVGYVPLSIILLTQQPTWKGFVILAYGLLVVGVTDNVARFLLQKKLGDVHPLITVLGVILGINLFGFIGIIFGPILISLFVLLVQIYNDEFNSKSIKR
jgi:predicted PurR-regulated permease PerM